MDHNIDERELYESENYNNDLNNDESLKENKILDQEINFNNEISNNKQSLIQEQYYIAYLRCLF